MTVLSSLKRQCGAESVQVHIALLSPRNARRVFVSLVVFVSRVAVIPISGLLEFRFIYWLCLMSFGTVADAGTNRSGWARVSSCSYAGGT